MNKKLQKGTLKDNILLYHSAELYKVHFVCKTGMMEFSLFILDSVIYSMLWVQQI